MKNIITILTLLLCLSCSIEEADKSLQEVSNGIDGTDGFNGLDGLNGLNGTDGQNGEDGLSTWHYTNQDGCIVLFQYHETNGELGWQENEERESGESDPICAEDGNDGYSTYINIETIESGETCEHGGKRIVIWTDTNRDQSRQVHEITQDIVWCVEKCPHVCTDVYDTINCKNDKQVYVMWIDGIYYYNIDLSFVQNEDGTANLYGKVNKHNSTKVFLIDVTYSDVVKEDIKDHNCIEVDSSEWVQYSTMTGTIRAVDGSAIYNVSRRGDPFQVGVGSNVTSSENVLGGSGWFITDGHATCQGDFNFLIGCR